MRRLTFAAGAALALLPGLILFHDVAGGSFISAGTDVAGPLVMLGLALAALLVWLVVTAVMIDLALAEPSGAEAVTPLQQPPPAKLPGIDAEAAIGVLPASTGPG